ncbi:hypothetical protein D3C83_214210 [compost metagenome]
MNRLARGYGEMLLFEPCIVLQSKNTTEPAGPFIDWMPPRSASSLSAVGSAMPYSCFFSDCL